jgi:hypothetical protein
MLPERSNVVVVPLELLAKGAAERMRRILGLVVAARLIRLRLSTSHLDRTCRGFRAQRRRGRSRASYGRGRTEPSRGTSRSRGIAGEGLSTWTNESKKHKICYLGVRVMRHQVAAVWRSVMIWSNRYRLYGRIDGPRKACLGRPSELRDSLHSGKDECIGRVTKQWSSVVMHWRLFEHTDHL